MWSEFINKVFKSWDRLLETLSESNLCNECVKFAIFFSWVTWKHFPMIEYALWESSTGSSSSKGLGETEWFTDWKETFHVDKWGTWNWFLTIYHTSSLGHGLINGTNAIIWGLDFDQENWFLQTWWSCELTSIQYSSASWEDLTTSSMDSISVESNIMDVESATSHALIAQSTFSGSPLESSFDWVLDFVQELYTLGDINETIGTSGIWAEAPNL